MSSKVQSWSNIPPQLFGVLQYQWEHLPHPVPRTLGRTGQTGLFRGQDVKTKCAGASCPLKNWQKIVPWSTSALWCSVCSCFLWAQTLLFPVTLHSHQKVNRKTTVRCPQTSLSHHGCHPASPERCTSSHPLWVTELGSQIYCEARCSFCSSLHKVDGSSEKSATAKTVYFQTLNSCFL